MSNQENQPGPQPGSDLDKLVMGPQELGLDEHSLNMLAEEIRLQGLTRERLLSVYNDQLVPDSPLLSGLLSSTYDILRTDILRRGEEESTAYSFRRGAALGYLLIDGSHENGAPSAGLKAINIASQYRDRPLSVEAMREAFSRLLDSQAALSTAFDKALEGMPKDTDRDLARVGAGTVVLGIMAAKQFGTIDDLMEDFTHDER